MHWRTFFVCVCVRGCLCAFLLRTFTRRHACWATGCARGGRLIDSHSCIEWHGPEPQQPQPHSIYIYIVTACANTERTCCNCQRSRRQQSTPSGGNSLGLLRVARRDASLHSAELALFAPRQLHTPHRDRLASSRLSPQTR